MKEKLKLVVEQSERIDKYIAQASTITRSDVKKLVEKGAISVDGNIIRKTSFQVRPGQTIRVVEVIPKVINAIPENIAIDIVYEDADIIIINKKSGMVVHPAPGNYSGTLVNALLFHFQSLSTVNGVVRPGIVHRIDKDTSGLLVVAKHNEAHAYLAAQLKAHNVKRTYLCWVEGHPQHDVTHINLPIGRDVHNRKKMAVITKNSKPAITHAFVLRKTAHRTLLRCELETGRTHQIRVHLAYIKNPIVGDPLYGRPVGSFGQQLHAYKLEFQHPTTKQKMVFQVDPPPGFLH